MYDVINKKKKILNLGELSGDKILSPDNSQIAFIKKQGDERDIFIINIDGSNLRRLTFDGGVKSSLTWSPKNN